MYNLADFEDSVNFGCPPPSYGPGLTKLEDSREEFCELDMTAERLRIDLSNAEQEQLDINKSKADALFTRCDESMGRRIAPYNATHRFIVSCLLSEKLPNPVSEFRVCLEKRLKQLGLLSLFVFKVEHKVKATTKNIHAQRINISLALETKLIVTLKSSSKLMYVLHSSLMLPETDTQKLVFTKFETTLRPLGFGVIHDRFFDALKNLFPSGELKDDLYLLSFSSFARYKLHPILKMLPAVDLFRANEYIEQPKIFNVNKSFLKEYPLNNSVELMEKIKDFTVYSDQLKADLLRMKFFIQGKKLEPNFEGDSDVILLLDSYFRTVYDTWGSSQSIYLFCLLTQGVLNPFHKFEVEVNCLLEKNSISLPAAGKNRSYSLRRDKLGRFMLDCKCSINQLVLTEDDMTLTSKNPLFVIKTSIEIKTFFKDINLSESVLEISTPGYYVGFESDDVRSRRQFKSTIWPLLKLLETLTEPYKASGYQCTMIKALSAPK